MKSTWNILQELDESATPEPAMAVMGRILRHRGIRSPREIHEYLNPGIIYSHSPFLLDGVREGTIRIRQALEQGVRIGIFSDSDLDGITSMVILQNLLRKCNADLFLRHLKEDEQYGLTREIIDEFINAGIRLIITVDSGIRDIDEIRHAREHGIDVIVVDHHEQDKSLPDAIIINPKIHGSRYPFKELAGVGVTFKLCHALLLSYLPGYEQDFFILLKDDTCWHLGIMKDGILESAELFSDKDILVTSLQSRIREGCMVISADDPSHELITVSFPGIKAYRLMDLATSLANGSRPRSRKDLYDTIAVKPEAYVSPLEPLSMIVFYLQYAGSAKIMSFINDAMGLLAIGTVADVVPLVGENRHLVSAGFAQLSTTSHRGLEKLINGDRVNARKIGWGIAPLLNAPGRVGRTSLTLDFFLEENEENLAAIIDEIKSINDGRKDAVSRICETLIEAYNQDGPVHRNMVVIKSPLIPEGYAGLIANRLSDHLKKPAIAIAFQQGKDQVKGSGRCRNGIDFFSALKNCESEFERVGGHAQAFGFTLHREKIDDIMNLIDNAMDSMDVLPQRLNIDGELSLGSVTTGLADLIEKMEPTGKGNDIPLFIARNIRIQSFSRIGNGKHGKYTFKGHGDLSALGWNAADDMQQHHEAGEPIDMVFRLEKNTYLGRVEPRVIIVDMDNAGMPD